MEDKEPNNQVVDVSKSDFAVYRDWLSIVNQDFRKLLKTKSAESWQIPAIDVITNFLKLLQISKNFSFTQSIKKQTNKGKHEKSKKKKSIFKSSADLILMLYNYNSQPEVAFASATALVQLFKIQRNEIISDEIKSKIESVFESAISDFHPILIEGKIDELDLLLKFLKGHNPIQYRKSIESLRKINISGTAKYPLISREFLSDTVGERKNQEEAKFADETQSVVTTQLAYTLIQAWDANQVNTSDKIYTLIENYCKNFANLTLFGDVNETASFRPDSYEGNNIEIGQKVKIVRPGVQWTNKVITKIIFKAKVIPIKE